MKNSKLLFFVFFIAMILLNSCGKKVSTCDCSSTIFFKNENLYRVKDKDGKEVNYTGVCTQKDQNDTIYLFQEFKNGILIKTTKKIKGRNNYQTIKDLIYENNKIAEGYEQSFDENDSMINRTEYSKETVRRIEKKNLYGQYIIISDLTSKDDKTISGYSLSLSDINKYGTEDNSVYGQYVSSCSIWKNGKEDLNYSFFFFLNKGMKEIVSDGFGVDAIAPYYYLNYQLKVKDSKEVNGQFQGLSCLSGAHFDINSWKYDEKNININLDTYFDCFKKDLPMFNYWLNKKNK